MIFPFKALSLTRFCVVLLCLFVVIVSSLLNAQTFVPSDSVVFVSKDSYLYADSPIYISDQTFRKDSSKKWSKTVIKRSSPRISNQKSANTPTDNLCYKSCPTGKHSLGLLFNSSSIAVIGASSPVKFQHKIIPSSFLLSVRARRDEEKHVYNTFYPFQLKHITINHFGRPPPNFKHG
ncbi:hypothetical protein [Chryseobacterium lineare]